MMKKAAPEVRQQSK